MAKNPRSLVVLGDALAAGRRDVAGLGLALRIAHRLKGPAVPNPVLPIDLSGPGGLRGASARITQTFLAPQPAWCVVVLGLEDAAKDPPIEPWLDGLVALVSSLCGRMEILTFVVPYAIGKFRPVGPYNHKRARRFVERIRPDVVPRIESYVDEVISIEDLPETMRSDDVWPKASGYDWISDRIAGTLLRLAEDDG